MYSEMKKILETSFCSEVSVFMVPAVYSWMDDMNKYIFNHIEHFTGKDRTDLLLLNPSVGNTACKRKKKGLTMSVSYKQ